MRFGPQICGDLDAAASREWLVADGLGGFAMGTVAGLRTRRYHGLQVVATQPPGGRMLGLGCARPGARRRRRTRPARGSRVGERRRRSVRATSCSRRFDLEDGVPRWRWQVGEVVLEREVAAMHGRPAVAVVTSPGTRAAVRSVSSSPRSRPGATRTASGSPTALQPSRRWRTASSSKAPTASPVRASRPAGEWYRGVRYREEAARGLNDREDLWLAGTFAAELEPGETLMVSSWATAARRRRADAGRAGAGPLARAGRARARRGRDRRRARPGGGPDGRRRPDDRRRLPVVRRLVARHDDVVRGAAARDRPGRRRPRTPACAARPSSARACSRTRSTAGCPSTTRSTARSGSCTPSAGTSSAPATSTSRPSSCRALISIVDAHVAGTRYGIHVDPADGLAHPGRGRGRADLDGRARRRRPGHAARRQAGGGQRALDQRAGDRRRPAGADGRRLAAIRGTRAAGSRILRPGVPARRPLRRRRRRHDACGRTSSSPCPCHTRRSATPRSSTPAPRCSHLSGCAASTQPIPATSDSTEAARPSATARTTRARSGRG